MSDIKNNSNNQYRISRATMPLLAYTVRMYASVVAYVYRLSVGFNFESNHTYELTYMYCRMNDVWQIALLNNNVSFKDSYVRQSNTYNVPVLPLQQDQTTQKSLCRVTDVCMLNNKSTRLGTDSHEDITCIGLSGRILRIHENRTCLVKPFDDTYEPMKDIK